MRIVGRNDFAARKARNEHFAENFPFLIADGNVLQVRFRAADTTGSGNGLIEAGMNA